jgi:hypothetical protein
VRRAFLLPGLLTGLLTALGCGGTRQLNNPVRLTLVNRTGGDVTGAWLRFDREIASFDRLGERRFDRARLRIRPADTLNLGDGRLGPGESVSYEIAGVGGPPRVVEGRWLVEGAIGSAITDADITLE